MILAFLELINNCKQMWNFNYIRKEKLIVFSGGLRCKGRVDLIREIRDNLWTSDWIIKKLLGQEKKGRVFQTEATVITRAGCNVVSSLTEQQRPGLLEHR